MANGVGEQILALGLTKGYQYTLLNFLVRDMNGFKDFMQNFYTGHIIEDIAAYQKHKREVNRMELGEFILLFDEDRKKGLEALLQEPISSRQVEYMDVYNVSPITLYNKFTKNSNRSYVGLVKEKYELPYSLSDDFLLTT